MTLASRIAVMDQGVIRQIGAPSEIYEHPNSRFVAGFIGSINMVDGEVTRVGKDGCEVLSASLGKALLANPSQKFDVGEKVSFAIRPEKISISRKATTARNVLKGTMQDFGYFGKDSLYRIKLATGQIITVNAVNTERKSSEETTATWEDEVYLTIPAQAAMVFKNTPKAP